MKALFMSLGVVVTAGAWGQAGDSVWPPGASPAELPADAVQAGAGTGGLTTYASLAEFLTAVGGAAAVTIEDFEGGFATATAVKTCFEALSIRSDDPCFVPGDLEPGFAMRASRGSVNFDGVVLLGSVLIGAGTTIAGANAIDPPANATRINFDPRVTAVAMDVYDGQLGEPVDISAHAADGSVIGSLSVDPPAVSDPAFAGFTSSSPIAYVEVNGSVDGAGELIDNLHFGGGPGRLASDPDIVDFGAVNAGAAATRSVTWTNEGGLDVTISALSPSSEPFSIAADDCSGTTLTPGATCSADVTFGPAYAGRFDASLEINAGVDAPDLPLRGNGVVPRLLAAPGAVDFGTVGAGATSAAETVTLMNRHAGRIEVTGVDIPAGVFARDGGSCSPAPFELEPGASCTVGITFSPDAAGSYNQRLTVTSNADPAQVGVSLTGEGAQAGQTHAGEEE